MASQPQFLSAQPPRHVAIIMDGNGRWAKKRMLPRAVGHRKGAEAVRRCVEAAIEQGVSYLTLFAFSSENWNRPAEEVSDLMDLLRHYLRKEVNELNEKGVQLRFIGDRHRLSDDTIALMDTSERVTADNARLKMNIALNYGAQSEIVNAARCLAQKVATGELAAADITEECFSQALLTTGLPDPDLIIRTSGEQRLSNFMLWQAAYAELVFLDVLWPDFDGDNLANAISQYHKRDRRYGAR